jgi:MATE family multidrug resistance protein
MSAGVPARAPGYAEIVRQALPIMLANAAAPLLGLADTTVIGHVGTVSELGAIALGALVFNFVYWGFGFLRMGTTGFVAQASGCADEAEVRATLARAVGMAIGIGTLLIVIRSPIAELSLRLLGASDAVQAISKEYLLTRIWGAPAALASFALVGTLIGLGQSRALFGVQLATNVLNAALDVLFAWGLGWGATGVAAGTAIAEWLSCLLSGLVVVRLLVRRHGDREAFFPRSRLRDWGKLLRTLSAHADILIRTLLLLCGFAWFTKQGARFGDVTLAGNHVLLQFISFSAFFLDGYAFVTEAIVGSALGARRRAVFTDSVRRTSVLAGLTALALALGLVGLGDRAIALLTDLQAVRAAAQGHLVYAGIYVMVAVAAFQLDGIFIGATCTREMRNAALVSLAVFLGAGYPLVRALGNQGLWIAFIVYAAARAISLGAFYPRLGASHRWEEPPRS